jgi:hypothetical protein
MDNDSIEQAATAAAPHVREVGNHTADSAGDGALRHRSHRLHSKVSTKKKSNSHRVHW